MNMSVILRILNWLEDIIEGEMIESEGYNNNYYCRYPKSASLKDLDLICNTINPLLKAMDYPIRICCVAGEIRPVKEPEIIKILDL